MKLSAGQYYGNIGLKQNINGLILTRSFYKKEFTLPLHHHENPYFCYVLKGGYVEQSSKFDESCSKGDILFHPTEHNHKDTFKDEVSVCFNLELTEQWQKLLNEKCAGNEKITKSCDTNLQRLVLKIYSEVTEPDDLSALIIEGLMLELLVCFSRTTQLHDRSPAFLKIVTEYIRDTCCDNPGLAELAGLAGVTPEHLSREFKSSFNTTIGEYIRNLKVERAMDNLNNSDKSLAEIAYETGFSDQSHLTRILKKVIGITPKKYRSLA